MKRRHTSHSVHHRITTSAVRTATSKTLGGVILHKTEDSQSNSLLGMENAGGFMH
jgi:hypothetical protein